MQICIGMQPIQPQAPAAQMADPGAAGGTGDLFVPLESIQMGKVETAKFRALYVSVSVYLSLSVCLSVCLL